MRAKAAELLSVQGSEEMQTQGSRAAFHLLCHPIAERTHRSDCDQQMVSLGGTGNGFGYETQPPCRKASCEDQQCVSDAWCGCLAPNHLHTAHLLISTGGQANSLNKPARIQESFLIKGSARNAGVSMD